jgi:hypothetical protein
MTAETVSTLIQSIARRLDAVGIEDAGIDARLLLRSAFGWTAAQQLGQLLDHPPANRLGEKHVSRFSTLPAAPSFTGEISQ